MTPGKYRCRRASGRDPFRRSSDDLASLAAMLSIQQIYVAALVAASAIAGGCASSSSSSSVKSDSAGASTSGGSASPSGSPGALSAEAQSAATGDIPDNQVFLTLHNRSGGYSMFYPEGWSQQGSGPDVTIRDKNNLVHVVIGHGGAPSLSAVTSQLTALKRSTPTLTFTAPQQIQLASAQAIKATYTTQSAPNPVTGKRVMLIVDRYELASNGRVAVVDLGTPRGVDNVDAYRKMIQSFTWR
jgi:hypothetical protein